MRMDAMVTILMSVYNGEKYIAKQLESILGQKGVRFQVIIRDDGSVDNTKEIIKEYAKKNNSIKLIEGKNIGVRRSFMELIKKAPKSQYYAFADQDDIWYSDKLAVAADRLRNENSDIPQLYVCNQNCIDEDGNFLYLRLLKYDIQPSVINTLFKNEYSGCTMVYNEKLLDNLLRFIYFAEMQQREIMHDTYTMIIAQLTGKVIYDAEAHMDFRRHGNNYTEAKMYKDMRVREKMSSLKGKYRSFRKALYNKGRVRKMCSILVECFFDEIENDDKRVLYKFKEYADSPVKWLEFLIHNEYAAYFPSPKLFVYVMIFFRIY